MNWLKTKLKETSILLKLKLNMQPVQIDTNKAQLPDTYSKYWAVPWCSW